MFATLFGFDLDRDMAATLITAALAVATWYARSKVTPVADPVLPPHTPHYEAERRTP